MRSSGSPTSRLAYSPTSGPIERVIGESPRAGLHWPLFGRFPGLARLPRVELRTGPTPVESLDSVAPDLWIKRDDLTALPLGGNKVRSLEFLLGDIEPGSRIATTG